MEPQFGLELSLLSQILKKLLLTVYTRIHPSKMKQLCNSHWHTLYILKENRLGTCVDITTGNGFLFWER